MSERMKRSGELIRGVFKILLNEPNGLHVKKDILPKLEEALPPRPDETGAYEKSGPGILRYEENLRFDTINCVKAGWLVKNRGHWSLTDAGKAAYHSIPDPEQFLRKSREEYQQWKKNRSPKIGDVADDGESDDEAMPSVTLEIAEENAWAEVEGYLSDIPPYDFQEVVAGLLEGMGLHIEWIAPPGPDGGVDIHATDGGVSGRRIKVQVKRRKDAVSVQDVGYFHNTLEEGDTGLFINTGGFTRDAKKDARHGKRHLILIDAKRFFDLWVSHYEKIPEKYRRLLPIKLVAFLNPPQ